MWNQPADWLSAGAQNAWHDLDPVTTDAGWCIVPTTTLEDCPPGGRKADPETVRSIIAATENLHVATVRTSAGALATAQPSA
ncbi:hypothetical protein FCN77_08135 [Arthrobacter sp. 24S4-2]|nr:hypothetical protein FCN77_08135 [Arthrobacter sp. 24S4-2]